MAPANPIQIVPLRGDALAAPVTTAKLTYRGGPLLPQPQVFTFFWGAAWQHDPQSGLLQQINQFFDFILTSSLLDQLGEYSVPGISIGHGSHSGSVTVAATPPSTLADSDIQQFIQQQLSSNSLVPQPTPSSLYFVFLPPGVSITLDSGASCSNFCGYHSDMGSPKSPGLRREFAGAPINAQIFYAVMPYPDCTGCAGSLSVLDALTSTSSHELCEAITDPVPGQGWYDDQNGEIGDICAWQTKKLGPYTAQLEWSNHAGRCI